MGTRSSIPGVVAILVVMGLSSLVFAGPVHIYHGDFNLPIPAPDDPESEYGRGWMDAAVIEIPDHFIIIDLNVCINLTHSSIFDLKIRLEHSTGPNLWLNWYNYKYEYLEGVNYTRSIFDDEALVPIEQGQAPFAGRFKPRTPNLLSIFDGQDAFGSWTLRIHDRFYDDIGKLDSFELIITIPEPATAILFIFSGGLAILSRPRRYYLLTSLRD